MKNSMFAHVKGFSLVEAMVAGVVFTIAVAGVFSSISSTTSSTSSTATVNKNLIAAYCGQQVLESFRSKVDARDWSSGSLTLGDHTLSGPTLAPYSQCAGVTSVVYTVSDAGNGARKVVANVNW